MVRGKAPGPATKFVDGEMEGDGAQHNHQEKGEEDRQADGEPSGLGPEAIGLLLPEVDRVEPLALIVPASLRV